MITTKNAYEELEREGYVETIPAKGTYVANKNIELIIFKIPSQDVGCYEEINLWLKLGWIKLYDEAK